MKSKQKAKITYQTGGKRNKYGIDSEGYIIEIQTANGWEMNSFFPMISKQGEEEKEFVHYSIIWKIVELLDCGYFVIMDKTLK